MTTRRLRKVLDNLWGPTGTVLLHVLLVLLLLRIAIRPPPPPDPPSITAKLDTIKSVDPIDLIDETLEKWTDEPIFTQPVKPPRFTSDVEPPPPSPPRPPGPEPGDIRMPDVLESPSRYHLDGLYFNRTDERRQDALDRYSGGRGVRTERSVLNALDWLRDHQSPDGSWGPRYPAAMTGLALLTFLAHGETTMDSEYWEAVRRGLRFLLRSQKNGVFVGGGPRWDAHMAPEQIRCYEHAIATYAVSEACTLTQIPFLRPAMEDAVQVIIDGQHAAGGWDYGYRLDAEANTDVSLAGWHIQALKAAKASGARNRGLESALASAIRSLQSREAMRQPGFFQYGTRLRNEEADMAMTGVAVLCMQLSGHVMDAESREGMRHLMDVHCRWLPEDPRVPGVDWRQTGGWPLYAWYYITQARFQQGGRAWESWNREFADMLCERQNPDGSWCPAPASAEARYGPVYCTSLATLMLEVYYRILPTYQQIEVSEQAEPQHQAPEFIVTIGEEA